MFLAAFGGSGSEDPRTQRLYRTPISPLDDRIAPVSGS